MYIYLFIPSNHIIFFKGEGGGRWISDQGGGGYNQGKSPRGEITKGEKVGGNSQGGSLTVK